ncbi:MAG: exo-alpha-sialidase [Ruminococcaceae bacterium]|nr:exo-alpha-sialidase [Oscillospiraceae bacterium]
MKQLFSTIIYENPLPQLRSIISAFPNLCELADGSILAAHQMGEAFESVDGAAYLSRSCDGGKTWSEPWRAFDETQQDAPMSGSGKLTLLPDGRLMLLGYAFFRENPDLPIGNPQTGGLLDDQVFWSVSEDQGRTWSRQNMVSCTWGPHVEASAPLSVLQNGHWATPITGFPDWDGNMTDRLCGRLLYSHDQGKTWHDDVVCMAFPGDSVTCYEQRMCELEDGTLVVIGWNEDIKTGERLNNHVTISKDHGKTFSAPLDTGIRGQASSVCALGGMRLLALHAIRRDTDRPGIYAYLVDLSDGTWKIEEETVVWEPQTPVLKNSKMAEVFAFLKFGQPSAILLKNGDLLMSHWLCEEGCYKTCATRIQL